MFLFNTLELPRLVQYDTLDLTGMLSMKTPPGVAAGTRDRAISEGQPPGTNQHRCNTGMAQRKRDLRCNGGLNGGGWGFLRLHTSVLVACNLSHTVTCLLPSQITSTAEQAAMHNCHRQGTSPRTLCTGTSSTQVTAATGENGHQHNGQH